MEITEFLLARIAEHELAVRRARECVLRLGGAADRPAVVIADSDGSPLWSTDVLRAECEAKRQIVNEIEGTRATATYTTRLLTILMYLALPYADHPDYRPEWRPSDR